MNKEKVLRNLDLILSNEKLTKEDRKTLKTSLRIIKRNKDADKEYWKGLFTGLVLILLYFSLREIIEVIT